MSLFDLSFSPSVSILIPILCHDLIPIIQANPTFPEQLDFELFVNILKQPWGMFVTHSFSVLPWVSDIDFADLPALLIAPLTHMATFMHGPCFSVTHRPIFPPAHIISTQPLL